ncbi:ABC transporter ATP-binding protein [Streptomyces ficellus]|uniref:ABC transporter ATP-binding protein n=1 Tax=Streptomyces ficellus TaxID=1977088 RepID=A0ABT7ZBM4_9ACTN|nr:ABC transporter ATP-binding protein [Streptomyces ficellus]MDN3296913.1 ABC transporter ATP-binding protein [Streptomyces ficellus]
MARATTVEGVTVIATESLSKRFPTGVPPAKRGGVTALDRLSLDIGPGVTGLVGANGAGKSTMIKILLGLSPATEGRAEVLGLDVATSGTAIRERVGYMPEHDCLPPDVSATEFVVHMARMSGLPPTAARERTADTLRHVGLYEERYRPIGGYSTGMKQRVKLAQALVHDPKLVLLDEPTNGLDPVGRDEMLGLIRRVHTDFGISVLVTSHLLGELERTCDHVVVIDGGRLLRSSSTSDFTQLTATLAVEVTDTDTHPDGTAALRKALTAAGIAIHGAPEGTADGLPGAGHVLLLEATGEETYDIVRDTVADLGLGLVRMEQRRHHIAEVFRPEAAAAQPQEAQAR